LLAPLVSFGKLVEARKDSARREKLFTHPDLTYLFWESSLRCNLRCAHCGSSCEAKSPVRELETSEILAIVDSIAEDFDARRIFVSITGGEPLLRHDLYDVVERMTQHGMRSCIVTNGTLLGETEAKRLVDCGMRTVSISIDGTRELHDKVRGKGTFDRSIKAFDIARRMGFNVAEAITCVRPENLDCLPEFETVLRDAGANLWRLITIDRMGRVAGTEPTDLWLDPPQIRRVLDFVQARRELSDLGVQFSCGGFLGLDRELAVRHHDGQCYAGLCVGSILCDGQVSACPSLPRSWAQGSCLERRFSDIWFNEFKRFRDLQCRKSGPCEDCSWFKVCLGGGLHERLAQPDQFCWLDRQGL
jgi:radical SAM protein with 4Fe4S-binding SPASM domain